MPYLALHTNVAIAPEASPALIRRTSRAVSELLGKPEAWVMVALLPNLPLSFAGTADPAAYVELKSIGLPHERAAELCLGLCALLKAELGLDPARVYIELTDVKGELWGWNGETF